MTSKRKTYSPEFKAKVALEALRQDETISQISARYGVHPVQISHWKKQAIEHLSNGFKGGRTPKLDQPNTEALYAEIGRLKVELDWLKKKAGPLR